MASISDFTRFKPTEGQVEILCWSNKMGIIGCKKRNGQEYLIRKKKQSNANSSTQK